jgi:hypothetical protein
MESRRNILRATIVYCSVGLAGCLGGGSDGIPPKQLDWIEDEATMAQQSMRDVLRTYNGRLRQHGYAVPGNEHYSDEPASGTVVPRKKTTLRFHPEDSRERVRMEVRMPTTGNGPFADMEAPYDVGEQAMIAEPAAYAALPTGTILMTNQYGPDYRAEARGDQPAITGADYTVELPDDPVTVSFDDEGMEDIHEIAKENNPTGLGFYQLMRDNL